MARFEPHEAADSRLGETVGAATEQLRAALEREAVEILKKAHREAEKINEAAGSEAASIEEAARRRAAETEREALTRAEEAGARAEAADARAQELRAQADQEVARAEAVRASHADRIDRALADVDAMEERLRAGLADLRGRLNAELEEIRPPTQPRTQPPQEAPEPPPPPAQVDSEPHIQPTPAFSGPVPLSVATEVGSATERNPVLDDMMRAQILNMRDSGAPRGDAERFLERFRLGESYLGMLDDIYSDHGEHDDAAAQGKRRRFRRRGS